MNHNLKLNAAAATTVAAALLDVNRALDAANGECLSSSTPSVSAIRAYLGTVRDAAWRIEQIVFETDQDDSDYGVDAAPIHGIVRPSMHCPVCDQDTTLPLGCPKCEDDLTAVLDEEDRQVAKRTLRDDMLTLLDEGVITIREFSFELDKRGIDQSHPCIQPGCDHTVQFDCEPYCFTHSPDEGSEVIGYSYMVNARRAKQTADSCENFIM